MVLQFLYHQALGLLKDLEIISLLDVHDIQLMYPFFPGCPTDPFLTVSLSGPVLVVPLCHALFYLIQVIQEVLVVHLYQSLHHDHHNLLVTHNTLMYWYIM